MLRGGHHWYVQNMTKLQKLWLNYWADVFATLWMPRCFALYTWYSLTYKSYQGPQPLLRKNACTYPIDLHDILRLFRWALQNLDPGWSTCIMLYHDVSLHFPMFFHLFFHKNPSPYDPTWPQHWSHWHQRFGGAFLLGSWHGQARGVVLLEKIMGWWKHGGFPEFVRPHFGEFSGWPFFWKTRPYQRAGVNLAEGWLLYLVNFEPDKRMCHHFCNAFFFGNEKQGRMGEVTHKSGKQGLQDPCLEKLAPMFFRSLSNIAYPNVVRWSVFLTEICLFCCGSLEVIGIFGLSQALPTAVPEGVTRTASRQHLGAGGGSTLKGRGLDNMAEILTTSTNDLTIGEG